MDGISEPIEAPGELERARIEYFSSRASLIADGVGYVGRKGWVAGGASEMQQACERRNMTSWVDSVKLIADEAGKNATSSQPTACEPRI
jgi:hypothetical protein